MRIFRHFTELPANARGGAVALGNFDGVHRGHQVVIGTAVRLARQDRLPCVVMTFEPHPRSVFGQVSEPFRLTPFRIKARHIEAQNVDFLIAQHFDQEFARHTAAEFVERVLVDKLRARHVVVGYDYVFGKGREGDAQFLNRVADKSGFAVTRVDPVTATDGAVYSSTLVRTCLLEGRPLAAAELLGRYWEVEGRVEPGDQRGRRLGFPTANLKLGEFQRPALGVYAVRAGVDRGASTVWHDGVANFGRRPSFDDRDPLLEVHLFDFSSDIYNQHLRVALVAFLRPEQRFESLDELRSQIVKDTLAARTALAARHLPNLPGPSVVPAPATDPDRPDTPGEDREMS
ncbi:MAG: bifunctional riboflavin kinase/FAD synthetase [Alphaproteobacteria bacterium]|nr:bifunctional riboflavin kinase/FAD synthetase [Alphaproteobacteria bacterium]